MADMIESYLADKESALNWRERRHSEWLETYLLYRNRVITNRLTQRQTVNVPLMKYSINTLMKDIDDAPALYFDCLDNDAQKEVFYNEYWKEMGKENKLLIKDIIDKRLALLFGRSFKKQNIVNGRHDWEVVDPQNMLVDRHADPSNLDTARFMIHTGIFRSLSQLQENPYYDKSAVAKLKRHWEDSNSQILLEGAQDAVNDQYERMQAMGVPDVITPILSEPTFEINEYFRMEYDSNAKEEVFFYVVIAEDLVELFKAPLYQMIGDTRGDYWYNHTIFTSWSSEPERTDFWNDGVGDILRPSNKILNTYQSQKVENRTLRNFGMHYYDSSDKDFVPQTFTPVPWGWFPVPGRPQDVVQKVDIPDLSDSNNDMAFILDLAEKASAATTAQQGQTEKSNVTLGEVQLALSNAKERVRSLSPLYTEAWEEFGTKYIKLLEAAGDLIDPVEIQRKGREGKKMYTKTISPKDWYSRNGWRVEVRDMSQTRASDIESLQKLQAVKAIMPQNLPLDTIFKRKIAEFAELSAQEVKEVMEYEKQSQMRLPVPGDPMASGMPQPAQMAPSPALPQPGPQRALPAPMGGR